MSAFGAYGSTYDRNILLRQGRNLNPEDLFFWLSYGYYKAMNDRKKSLLSLILLVPAPSIGALSAMVLFPDTMLGKIIFALSKIWLFAFPLVWYVIIFRNKISLSPPRKGGFGMGLLTGVVISLAIFAVYLAFGSKLFDHALFTAKMKEIGLASIPMYAGGALYWILINSVLEEYVWRWFVVEQCERLVKPVPAAIFASLFFTLHHVVALQVYCGTAAVVICSAGVFTGGLVWSMMYVKYRSVWPGYLSHAIVDLCIFGIGALMLFG